MSTRLGREAHKLKITLNAAWIAGPCQKLLSFFCDAYNKKFADKPLAATDMALRIGTTSIPLSDAVSKHISDYNEVLVVHRPACASGRSLAAPPAGSVICGNFGCGDYFLANDNHDSACSYHAKGPVFHDTAKFWGCCPQTKAYDWDDFEKVPKCCTGRHVQKDVNMVAVGCISASPTIDNVALTAAQVAAMTAAAARGGGGGAVSVESSATAPSVGNGHASTSSTASGPRRKGPREFEEATSAASAPAGQVVDGWATCRNFGCQKKFRVEENTDTACQYHTGGPVFWDTYKYWACCPQKKNSDFDDFVKVPGCATGKHKL